MATYRGRDLQRLALGHKPFERLCKLLGGGSVEGLVTDVEAAGGGRVSTAARAVIGQKKAAESGQDLSMTPVAVAATAAFTAAATAALIDFIAMSAGLWG